jgi:hypothetical protein
MILIPDLKEAALPLFLFQYMHKKPRKESGAGFQLRVVIPVAEK